MSLYAKTKAARGRLVRPIAEWDEVDDLMYRTNWGTWNLLSFESQLDVIISCIYWYEVHNFAKPFHETTPTADAKRDE